MLHKILKNSFASFLIVLMFSCGAKDAKKFNTLKELTDNAKANVEFIEPNALKAALQSHDKFYLIDCRESAEFDSVCIAGAISIPRGLIESQISEKAPAHRSVVYVYCSNGERSALVAKVLPQLKYAQVKVLAGGIEKFRTKFPELLELHPVRGQAKAKVAKASGGCGG